MSGPVYNVPVEADSNGELVLSFPDALLNQVGWDVGDNLLWEELPNGSFVIRKDNDE